MEVVHLKTGWNDAEFEQKIQAEIYGAEENGFIYKDIKISSDGHNCLLIFEFKKKGDLKC